jgi:CRISPR-associated endonuclease/helicase Cas3
VPVVEDHNPTEVSVSWREHLLQANSNHGFEQLDSGWLDLFQQMQDQYGAWGIAYLEAILRLADRRQSIWEREEKP